MQPLSFNGLIFPDKMTVINNLPSAVVERNKKWWGGGALKIKLDIPFPDPPLPLPMSFTMFVVMETHGVVPVFTKVGCH